MVAKERRRCDDGARVADQQAAVGHREPRTSGAGVGSAIHWWVGLSDRCSRERDDSDAIRRITRTFRYLRKDNFSIWQMPDMNVVGGRVGL